MSGQIMSGLANVGKAEQPKFCHNERQRETHKQINDFMDDQGIISKDRSNIQKYLRVLTII